ncbi:MAG: monovalent cation/H(+) antiporter subunit G [Firmicutes bacterium]|nr:monovalent cation/H(+) antiporter subunit G [Bacillota bacterium]
MTIVVGIFLVASWFFIFFGLLAIFKLENLYTRILSASTIDTVASILLLIGLMFVSEELQLILRLFMLLIFLFITGPISSHVNIRSAFLVGIPLEKGKNKDA